MRKLVFAIMVLFVIFSVIRGVADTTEEKEIARAETTVEVNGL